MSYLAQKYLHFDKKEQYPPKNKVLFYLLLLGICICIANAYLAHGAIYKTKMEILMKMQLLFSNWALDGSQVVWSLGGLFFLVMSVTLGLRYWLRMRSERLLRSERGGQPGSPLERKYAAVRIGEYGGSLRLFGAIAGMLFCGIALAWTQWERSGGLLAGNLQMPEELLLDAKLVVPEPTKVTPPPPKTEPKVLNITDEKQPDKRDSKEEPEDAHPDGKDGNTPSDPGNTGIVGTPISKPDEGGGEERVQPKVIDVLLFAEQMPRFPSTCEKNAKLTNKEKQTCSDKALMEFIYANIRYPQAARDYYIEGIVFVNFVVSSDGSIRNIEIIKSPSEILSQEARRVLQLMNDKNMRWTPGMQGGQNVAVKFNLPIKFKLQQ